MASIREQILNGKYKSKELMPTQVNNNTTSIKNQIIGGTYKATNNFSLPSSNIEFKEKKKTNAWDVIKTIPTSIAEGFNTKSNQAQRFLEEKVAVPTRALFSKNNYEEELKKYRSEKDKVNDLLSNKDVKKTKLQEILNPDYRESEVYKKKIEGNLSKGEEIAYGVGSAAGGLLPTIAITALTKNPKIGKAVFATSAQQGYTEQARSEGKTELQANIYGTIMGAAELATEQIGFNPFKTTLTKGSQGVFKQLVKSAIGEGLEEGIIEYVDSAVRSVGFKEEFDLKETTKQAGTSFMYGAILGTIMDASQMGISSAINVSNKINNNQDVTQSEIETAIKDYEKVKPNAIKEKIGAGLEIFKTNLESDTQTNVQDKAIAPIKQENVSNEPKTVKNDILAPVDKASNNLDEYLKLKAQYDSNKDMSQRNLLIKRMNELEDKLTPEELKTVFRIESTSLNGNQDNTNIQIKQEQALNVPQVKNNEVVQPIQENKLNIPTKNDILSPLFDSMNNVKQQQLEVINKSNPMTDDYHTGIRSVEDIIRTRKENQITNKYNKDIKNNINAKTKAANAVFYFDNNKQRTEFKDILKKYVGNSNIDRNAVKNDINNNFGTRKTQRTDDVLVDAKKFIRKNKIKVSDTVKSDFGSNVDFNNFRKSNFGKIDISNNGKNIDQVYLELNESYGDNLFPIDIINESEQLQRISEVSNMNPTTTESFTLDDDSINQATDYIMEYLDNEKNLSDMVDSINVSPKEVRKEKVKEYRMEARVLTENLFNWKDKQLGLQYSTETMERNFYDIIPSKVEADRINDNYVRPITASNAQKEKFIHEYNNKISQLKLNKNESIAVQMLGEYKYNPETTLTADKTYGFIEKNKLDKKKIENSIEVLRNTYDELIIKANKVLKEQGYKEIPYRKGYFPHFNNDKPSSIIGKMAEKLGWKIQKDSLPTDIAGMTDIFKPGKTWFGHSLERKGDATDYNALQGYDNYIRGIGDIIYHTENIQKIRSLENEIRYQYSEEGVKEQIESIYDNHELSADEMQIEIEKVYETLNNPMPNLVTELREYANGLANKKHSSDRTMEHDISRQIYSTMTNINNRVAANMVGLNISSAFTNFIPITQAWSQVSSPNMLKAVQQAINSNYKNDGFTEKSVFLTNRTNQAEKLYKTGIEKAGDKANIMFEGIDNFTANVVVRGKYLENIQKGMSETEAIKDADIFAKNVIAGRDKGSLPTIFNRKNPATKLLTMFQLEVKNQYGYMFKDLPRDLEKEGLAKLTGAFIKMFFGAWLYNKLAETLTGRKPAFSPADIIASLTGIATNDSLSTSKKVTGVANELSQDIPFIGGLVGGGRIPISAALPNIGITASSIATAFSDEDSTKKQTAINNLVKELTKPVVYLVPPFGGGQVKKTVEGLGMYNKDVPGSYTTSGKLRFPVKEDTLSKVQAGMFGQYASKEAREYFENSSSALSVKQVDEAKKNMQKDGTTMFEEYNKVLKERETNRLYNELSTNLEQGKDVSKTKTKLNKIENGLGDFLEHKYNVSEKAIKSDTKSGYTSGTRKNKVIDYILKQNLSDDEIIELYKYAGYENNKDSKTFENIKNVGIPIKLYIEHQKNTSTIKSDQDIDSELQGKTISGSKKEKIVNEIQKLKTNRINKLMLYAMEGYALTSREKTEIYNHVNKLKITTGEKENVIKSMSNFQWLKNGKLKEW